MLSLELSVHANASEFWAVLHSDPGLPEGKDGHSQLVQWNCEFWSYSLTHVIIYFIKYKTWYYLLYKVLRMLHVFHPGVIVDLSLGNYPLLLLSSWGENGMVLTPSYMRPLWPVSVEYIKAATMGWGMDIWLKFCNKNNFWDICWNQWETEFLSAGVNCWDRISSSLGRISLRVKGLIEESSLERDRDKFPVSLLKYIDPAIPEASRHPPLLDFSAT